MAIREIGEVIWHAKDIFTIIIARYCKRIENKRLFLVQEVVFIYFVRRMGS